MSNSINMVLSTVVIIIQALTVYIYLGYFFKFKITSVKLGSILFGAILISKVSLNIGTKIYGGRGIAFTILFLIMWWCLRGSVYKKIFHYSFLSSFLLIQENIGQALYMVVSGNASLFFLGMYAIILIFFIMLIQCLRNFKFENKVDVSIKEYLLLMQAPILSSIFLVLNLIHNSGILLVICLLLLWFNVSILYLYNYLTAKNYQVQMLQLEKLQLEFFRDFLQQEEEIRTLRHDLKNILASIAYYAERKDHRKIQELVADISKSIVLKNKHTGILALDAIISQKIKVMTLKNIDYKLKLQVPRDLDLSKQEIDICAILGNILDNAIEATPSEKSIKIMLAFKEGKLIFKVKNPYSGIRQQNHNKLRVGSSKRYGRQGIGLRSIKRRVAKYNGYYDFKAVNGEFTAFVVLPVLNKRKQEMCAEG